MFLSIYLIVDKMRTGGSQGVEIRTEALPDGPQTMVETDEAPDAVIPFQRVG